VSEHTEVLRLARLRQDELAVEQRRLTRLLSFYQGFSYVAVLLGIVVPVLAGSGLVSEGGLLATHRQLLAVAVVVTGMLTALHKGMNCEAYQAGSRRAINTLQSLIEGYGAIAVARDPAAAIEALEARLQQFRETAFDVPPLRQPRHVPVAAAP
jgi:hypothetical protein